MKTIIFDIAEIVAIAVCVYLACLISPLVGFAIACLWIGFIFGVAATRWALERSPKEGPT